MKFIDRNNFNLSDYALTAEEYMLKIKEKPRPVVLDIRAEDICVNGTVEGAYNMPAAEFAENLIQLPPFGAFILYSDAQDLDIEQTLKLLWENGFTDIYYVIGGYNAIMQALFEVKEGTIEAINSYLKESSTNAILLDIQPYAIDSKFISDKPDTLKFKVINLEGIPVYFEHKRLRLLEGTIVSWENGALKFDHPRWSMPKSTEPIEKRAQDILDREINPMVSTHGGYVKVLSVDNEVVYVEMTGGCQGCGLSAQTLKQGVEGSLLQYLPEISAVLDTTDHASGTNPYYVNT